MTQFKQIINNIVLREKIFKYVKEIHLHRLKAKKYKWEDIYRSFKRLARFNCVKELQYRLENEDIDSDLYALYNSGNNSSSTGGNSNNKNVEGYVGGVFDHRVIGLGEIACKRGNLKVIQYLHKYHGNQIGVFRITDMEYAIQNGHIDCALFLYHNRIDEEGYSALAISDASKRGYNELLELMLMKWNSQLPCSSSNLIGFGSNIDTIKLLYKYGWTTKFEDSSDFKSLDMIKYMKETFPDIEISLIGGELENRLDVIQYLFSNQHVNVHSEWLDYIARTGSLDTLKFLTEKTTEKCSKNAISKMINISIPMLEYLHHHHNINYIDCIPSVIASGNLDILIYLINEGIPTSDLMDLAVEFDQFHILKHLHENIKDINCDPYVMDKAIGLGRMDMVKFLHQNRSEGCTELGMSIAIQLDNLEMVKFLHENRTEGYDPYQIQNISSIEMVEFLQQNRTEGFDYNIQYILFVSPNIDLVKYAHYNFPNGPPVTSILTESKNLEVIKFLHENRKEVTTTNSSWTECKRKVLSFLIDHRINDKSMNPNRINDIIRYGSPMSAKKLHYVCKILKIKGWNYDDYSEKDYTRNHKYCFSRLETVKYAHLFTDIRSFILDSFNDASEKNNMEVFQFLLAQYPDVVKVQFKHITNIMDSYCGRGQLNSFKLLLQHYTLTSSELDQLIDLARFWRLSFVYDYLVNYNQH